LGVTLAVLVGLFFLYTPLFWFVLICLAGLIALGVWIKGGGQSASASVPVSFDGPPYRVYHSKIPGSALRLQHFISQPEEINVSSSLIMGENEVILVTAQATKFAAERLADEIEATGLELTYVYLDHAHLDHSQGASVLVRRFPNAKFVGAPKVVELQRLRMEADDQMARSRYGENAAVPSIPFEPLDTDTLTLEGSEIQLWHNQYGDVGIGEPDEPHTVIFIPELKALLPTDICYYNGHIMLGGTTPESRSKWKQQLRDWMALDLDVVIPGHVVRPDSADMTAKGVLEFSLNYIEEYEGVLAKAKTSDEVISEMIRRHPKMGHESALYIGTFILFGETHRLLFNKRIEKVAGFLPKALLSWADRRMFESKKAAANF
jgi:glyoxylase-like metal-dependent hydrolase (beta-lactamase superfamily II)